MIKNYFKVAFRSLFRDRFFSILNIFGLTVGIAAFLLISVYVSHELSHDRFHEKGDRIYAHLTQYYSPEGVSGSDRTSFLGGREFEKRIPEFEKVVQLSGYGSNLISIGEESFYEDKIFSSDADLFEVFDFPIINGSVDLGSPYKAVITESMAQKYFGNEDPIGKTFKFKKEQEYEIVAVSADPPANSYIQFNIILSEYHYLEKEVLSAKSVRSQWSKIAHTYFLVSEGISQDEMIEKMRSVAEEHFTSELYRNEEGELLYQPKVIPFRDIHLKSKITSGINSTGDIRYVYLFSAIAILILIIACINYINLSTAKSVKRAKETGIRKVIGASRRHLIRLYLAESFVLTTISVLLAFALAERVLPYYNDLVGRQLKLDYWGIEFFVTIVVINFTVSLLAGAYPAFKLSSFGPVEAIRGSKNPKGRSTLRKGLVLFQFLIAQLLIITTIIIQSQMSYLQTKDLGYDREHALYIDSHGELSDEMKLFKESLQSIPSVSSVARSNGVFTWSMLSFFPLSDIEGNEDALESDFVFADVFGVDHDFIDLMGLEIVEGRNFDPNNTSDEREAIIINQTAVKRFGWENPIGKKFNQGGKPKYVIGVMKDFHNESLRAELKPAFIELEPEATQFVNVRIAPGNVAQTLDLIEEEWDKLVADRPFDFIFYDDKYDQHYKSERRLGDAFIVFAGLAVMISLLGLVGLTAFSAEQRLKEIGIRKVLGASLKQLLLLLSKEFLLLIAVAFIIAVPITYYVMDGWLSVFKYRIEIGVTVYAIAIIASIMVAWMSASFLSLKVARRNPAEILRTE